MKPRVLAAVAALIAALVVPSTLLANPVSIPEPGYLVIDDAWYGFGVRANNEAGLAIISPLAEQGFHMQTALDVGACVRGSGLPRTPLQNGQSALSVSDVPAAQQPNPPDDSPPLLPAASSDSASLRLATCEGVAVVFLSSLDGDLNCQMRLAFPFAKRGVCPSLDAADRSYVFYADFD